MRLVGDNVLDYIERIAESGYNRWDLFKAITAVCEYAAAMAIYEAYDALDEEALLDAGDAAGNAEGDLQDLLRKL